MYAYPVILSQDDATITATFPDIPEAITFGEDKAEALLQAQDALETALEMYVDARRSLPVPSHGHPVVAPTLLVQAKLCLYAAMNEKGLHKADLARRLGWHMPQVDRVLDLNHSSKMPQIEQAASAIGVHMNISTLP